MGRFISSCTDGPCSGTDTRVTRAFRKYDKDKDRHLTLDDFLTFYNDACKNTDRINIVWSNLYAHHYKNDFSNPDQDELKEEEINTTSLPRYILASHQEYFDALFSLLDIGGDLAEEAWELINRLPTS